MSTEILINVRPNQTRVAYVDGGILQDLKVERKTAPTLVGSIYKGKVLRVLPGMQAAFVDIGLDRAAFLYVGDIRTDYEEKNLVVVEEDQPAETFMIGKRTPADELPLIQDILKEGQSLLVQVAKDPLGTKGARITTHITLPGRNLVYMPTLDHLGISRRIEDESERARLKEVVESLAPKGGVIVRTAGEGAKKEDLDLDLSYLYRLWKDIDRSYEKRKTQGLLYSEMDVELRALRDLLSDSVEKVIIDDEAIYKKVLSFVGQMMPKFKNRISLHCDNQPLFDLYDLDEEIRRSLGRQIWLKSGGYLIIDEAEALVVVDVNTGKYVGKKNFEDTILTTNIEAAKEIAHQLRVRNCGGIIIIDFIDMEKISNREKVTNLFVEEMSKDPAKTIIMPMSDLGLIQMTRKRIRPSLVSTMCEPCPYCEGKGYVKSKSTIANEIFRAIERESGDASEGTATVVHCSAGVIDWIYEEEAEALDLVEQRLGRSVAFKVEPGFHLEQHEINTI